MKILFILPLLFFTSCSLLKKGQFLNSGKIKQKEFYGKIHFDDKGYTPIIKLMVNGVEANFLFDTGASSNVISVELAAKLNLATLTTGYVNDSEGRRSILEYVAIDSITIDSISFLNTTAVVADLRSSEEASCFQLDGIIGTNLMQMAFWKIDYSEKSIYFSHDLSTLKKSDVWNILSFEPTPKGTPRIDLIFNNNRIKDLTFDTGFNGYISVPKKTLHLLDIDYQNDKTVYKTGATGFSLYGLHKKDTIYYTKIDKLSLGDLELNNQILEFKSSSNLIGFKFLSNYIVILDWTANTIYLKEVVKSPYNSIQTFGFGVSIKNNKLIVGSIFNNSESSNKLKIGDEIIALNGESYLDLSESSLCDLYISGPLKFDNLNYVEVKIKRGNDIMDINLEKQLLLK